MAKIARAARCPEPPPARAETARTESFRTAPAPRERPGEPGPADPGRPALPGRDHRGCRPWRVRGDQPGGGAAAGAGRPRILQPYNDLAKLFRKEALAPEGSSWVFLAAPIAAMACYLTVPLLIPVLTTFGLPLGCMGDILGGGFILSLASFLVAVALVTGTDPPYALAAVQGPLALPGPGEPTRHGSHSTGPQA
ncbi:MAG: NADH-quinone oxidoreductase subunit H [Streptosporangiaceae bacterium]